MYHLQNELSELENCSGRVPSKIEPAHFVVTEIGNMTLQECKVLPKGGRNIFPQCQYIWQNPANR